MEEIGCIATFLGHSYSDVEIDAIINNCSFERMQARPFTDYWKSEDEHVINTSTLVRRGQKGQWRYIFNEEQNAYVDCLLERKTNPMEVFYKF